MLRNLLVLTYFGTAYAINAINVHTSSFDSTSSTLRCSVEEGKEYAPDRLMSAIKFLEMVEEFKRVSVNKGLLPDLDEIKLIGSCSAENVKAPERVEIVCQVSERESVEGEDEHPKNQNTCNSELLAEFKKMQKKVGVMEEQISRLTKSNTGDCTKCDRDLYRRRRLLVDTDHVAFTATHSLNTSTFGPFATIVFDTMESNVGQGYDAKTGVFTCPYTGYYYFIHSALSPYNGHIETEIVLEGTPKAMIYAESSTPSSNAGSGYDQGSNSVVTYCEAGHRAWVRVHGNRGTNLYWERFSHFSGFMLWTL